ncbi:MAG: hypothetical protein K0R70_2361, partial [Steroidobacteraceae bacterium]|nr:hypothetical protein [Steroidobacteraceae bacterium]
VAELRRRHPDDVVLPVLFGAEGLVDLVTIDQALPPVPHTTKARHGARH